MKLKRLPEDFQVEELPLVAPGEQGRFAFYRLSKRGIGTLEAVEAICRRWNLAGRRGRYGGPKERAAGTDQVPAIPRRPRRAPPRSGFGPGPPGRPPPPHGPGALPGHPVPGGAPGPR